MNLFPAQAFDIDSIMKIERQAFIPQIQEKKSVFEKRIKTFPNGFLILCDMSEKVVQQNGSALTCGYICTELWSDFPSQTTDDKTFSRRFSLGHNIKSTHSANGTYLYVSSFALLNDYRGKGLGEKFFRTSLGALCGAFTNVQKVVLLASADWKNALRIYENQGFQTVRILKDFFPTLDKKAKADGIVLLADAKNFLQISFESNSKNIFSGISLD